MGLAGQEIAGWEAALPRGALQVIENVRDRDGWDAPEIFNIPARRGG